VSVAAGAIGTLTRYFEASYLATASGMKPSAVVSNAVVFNDQREAGKECGVGRRHGVASLFILCAGATEPELSLRLLI